MENKCSNVICMHFTFNILVCNKLTQCAVN